MNYQYLTLTPDLVNEAVDLVESYANGLYQPKPQILIGLFRLLDHAAGTEFSTYRLHENLLHLCQLLVSLSIEIFPANIVCAEIFFSRNDYDTALFYLVEASKCNIGLAGQGYVDRFGIMYQHFAVELPTNTTFRDIRALCQDENGFFFDFLPPSEDDFAALLESVVSSQIENETQETLDNSSLLSLQSASSSSSASSSLTASAATAATTSPSGTAASTLPPQSPSISTPNLHICTPSVYAASPRLPQHSPRHSAMNNFQPSASLNHSSSTPFVPRGALKKTQSTASIQSTLCSNTEAPPNVLIDQQTFAALEEIQRQQQQHQKQHATLTQELTQLENEEQSWMQTIGVYIGILGFASLIVLHRSYKDVLYKTK